MLAGPDYVDALRAQLAPEEPDYVTAQPYYNPQTGAVQAVNTRAAQRLIDRFRGRRRYIPQPETEYGASSKTGRCR